MGAMQITKSIFCLWMSSSLFACFCVYGYAYNRGALAVIIFENLDLSGGPSFALGFPSMLSQVIASLCAILAAVSLTASWRLNKQPLFSLPHSAALLFLVPMVLVACFSLALR